MTVAVPGLANLAAQPSSIENLYFRVNMQCCRQLGLESRRSTK
jgi:hypothetical protein